MMLLLGRHSVPAKVRYNKLFSVLYLHQNTGQPNATSVGVKSRLQGRIEQPKHWHKIHYLTSDVRKLFLRARLITRTHNLSASNYLFTTITSDSGQAQIALAYPLPNVPAPLGSRPAARLLFVPPRTNGRSRTPPSDRTRGVSLLVC
jgi:hypothetical protein